jgi:hypothetical protein
MKLSTFMFAICSLAAPIPVSDSQIYTAEALTLAAGVAVLFTPVGRQMEAKILASLKPNAVVSPAAYTWPVHLFDLLGGRNIRTLWNTHAEPNLLPNVAAVVRPGHIMPTGANVVAPNLNAKFRNLMTHILSYPGNAMTVAARRFHLNNLQLNAMLIGYIAREWAVEASRIPRNAIAAAKQRLQLQRLAKQYINALAAYKAALANALRARGSALLQAVMNIPARMSGMINGIGSRVKGALGLSTANTGTSATGSGSAVVGASALQAATGAGIVTGNAIFEMEAGLVGVQNTAVDNIIGGRTNPLVAASEHSAPAVKRSWNEYWEQVHDDFLDFFDVDI